MSMKRLHFKKLFRYGTLCMMLIILLLFQTNAKGSDAAKTDEPFSATAALGILIVGYSQSELTPEALNQIADDFAMVKMDADDRTIAYEWNNRFEITAFLNDEKTNIESVLLVVRGNAIQTSDGFIQTNQDIFDYSYQRINQLADPVRDDPGLDDALHAVWKRTQTGTKIEFEKDESGSPFINGDIHIRFVFYPGDEDASARSSSIQQLAFSTGVNSY